MDLQKLRQTFQPGTRVWISNQSLKQHKVPTGYERIESKTLLRPYWNEKHYTVKAVNNDKRIQIVELPGKLFYSFDLKVIPPNVVTVRDPKQCSTIIRLK